MRARIGLAWDLRIELFAHPRGRKEVPSSTFRVFRVDLATRQEECRVSARVEKLRIPQRGIRTDKCVLEQSMHAGERAAVSVSILYAQAMWVVRLSVAKGRGDSLRDTSQYRIERRRSCVDDRLEDAVRW